MPTVDIAPKELERLTGLKIPKDERARMEFFECVKGEIEEFTADNLKLAVADSNRLDIWTVDGIARALKAHNKGAVEQIKFRKSKYSVKTDSRLKSIRPYISIAVVKGVKLSDDAIKQLMQQQKRIDENYGRDRKRTSIGLYDSKLISYPLSYTITKPDENAFVPLDFSRKMMPGEILKDHPTAVKYSNLVSKLPILLDRKKKVLSLPPLINSNDLGKITAKTKDILVEVTGIDKTSVDNVLKIMALSLASYGGIVYANVSQSEQIIKLSLEKVNKLCGVNFRINEVKNLLRKAGYTADSRLNVKIPFYRTDIMNEVDVIEDIMINYGYNKFIPEYPQIATRGKLSPINKFSNDVKELCIGFGLQEVANFVLTSKTTLMSAMDVEDKHLIEIANPMSETFNCLRTWLLPSMLPFLATNTHAPYPQKIFEVGDVVVMNRNSEVGSDTIRKLCIVSAHEKANFAEAQQYLANLLGEYKLAPLKHNSLIEGRSVSIDDIGIMGEVHPKILENFGVTVPVVMLELDLAKLLKYKAFGH